MAEYISSFVLGVPCPALNSSSMKISISSPDTISMTSSRISNLLREDLKEKFPKANIDEKYTIWEVFSQLDEKFIFIFDEWDYIFNDEPLEYFFIGSIPVI